MKKVNRAPYISPELEIVRFDSTDIITSSGFGYKDDENDDPEW